MISLPPEVKNLSISVCLWVKSLTAKWIILQLLLQETHIILRLFSPHYIHKSPNLLHTAVKKIIITIFRLILRPPQPHYLFFHPNPLCCFFPLYPLYHPWDTTHMREYTVTRTYVHINVNTNTLTSWFVLGVISLTQGTLIMYFLCSSEGGGGDKRPADTTFSDVGWERRSGGLQGGSGWRLVS